LTLEGEVTNENMMTPLKNEKGKKRHRLVFHEATIGGVEMSESRHLAPSLS